LRFTIAAQTDSIPASTLDQHLYATPWADAIMRSIQENILEVIRARAERRRLAAGG
jgi:hypothetical protein